MLDFRVKKPSEALNWRYQEIIVTEEYLAEHAGDINLIELDSEYELGKKVLDVYLNGDRLTEGGGYEEVDSKHIRLDLRTYDEEGNEITSYLQVGDEIIIKEWYNTTSNIYGQEALNRRLTAVEKEVKDARNYSDDDIVHGSLRDRLNDMQDKLENIEIPEIEDIKQEIEKARDNFTDLDERLDYLQKLAEKCGGSDGTALSRPLLYNTLVTYTSDPATGNIVKEEAKGDFPYSKTRVYDPATQKLLSEVTVFEGKAYVCNYEYDLTGKKIKEYGDKVEFIATLTLHNYLKPCRYYVSKEYTVDDNGNVLVETVTGDIEYVKTFEYSHGKVVKESTTIGGETYDKFYLYDSNGELQRESGFSMKFVTTSDNVFCSLYTKDVEYEVDTDGNIVREQVTGHFSYEVEYAYEGGRIASETIHVDDAVYKKTYTYDNNGFISTELGISVAEFGDKLDVAYTLSGKLNKSLEFLLGEGNYEIDYEYNADGEIEREVLTGDYEIIKEYSYNSNGMIDTETIVRKGRATLKTYRYNSAGQVVKVVSETLRM